MRYQDSDSTVEQGVYAAVSRRVGDSSEAIADAEQWAENQNVALQQAVATESKVRGEPTDETLPRLCVMPEDTQIPGIKTASIVWKLPVPDDCEDDDEIGLIDEDGVIHQCSDDGHYSRQNLDEVLPYAPDWVVDHVWRVEQEARRLRECFSEIRDVAESAAKLVDGPKVEFPIRPKH